MNMGVFLRDTGRTLPRSTVLQCLVIGCCNCIWDDHVELRRLFSRSEKLALGASQVTELAAINAAIFLMCATAVSAPVVLVSRSVAASLSSPTGVIAGSI